MIILVTLDSKIGDEHIVYEVSSDQKAVAEIAIRKGLANWKTEWDKANPLEMSDGVEDFIEKELKQQGIQFELKEFDDIHMRID